MIKYLFIYSFIYILYKPRPERFDEKFWVVPSMTSEQETAVEVGRVDQQQQL